MKILIAFWLLVFSMAAGAQPMFLSKKDLAKNGLSEKQLDGRYGALPEQMVALDIPYSVVHKMKIAFESALGKDLKPLSITVHLYLSEEGRIDFLVYDISKYNMIFENGNVTSKKVAYDVDSLGTVLGEKLPRFLDGFVSSRNWGRKEHLRFFTTIGIYPNPGMEKVKPEKKDDKITDISDALSATDTLKVKTLLLERSLLTAFPDVVYRFPNLETLSLAGNDLLAISIDMARLPKLKNLDLTGNILKEGDIRITQNKSLQLLNLQKNQLVDVPDAVKNCKGLVTLWLGRNKLSSLSDQSFRNLRHIKDLNLYKAEIASLPKGVKKMRRLEVLDLYYNNLEVLPKQITKLKRVTHLAVAYNKLTTLPSKIRRMKKVSNLYAHHNRLSTLPAGITKLKNLKILDLGFNWFTDFPVELTTFTGLQELDLSSNNFHQFPQGLLNLKHLDKLFLRGNPFIEDKANVTYSSQLENLKSKNIEVFH
jgi:Leucine-rich repeat (LRR) protein